MDDFVISDEMAKRFGDFIERETIRALGIPAAEFETAESANLTGAKLREMVDEWRNKYPAYELHGKPDDIHFLLRFLGYPSARELYLEVDPYWPGDPMIITRYAFHKTMRVVPMNIFDYNGKN